MCRLCDEREKKGEIYEKIFLVSSIFFALTVFSVKVSANEADNEECGIQEAACAAYEELMNSFPESRSTGEKIYPNNYGGAYINDNGVLIVCVTDDSFHLMKSNVSGALKYEICEFSYNELEAVMDTLNEFKLSAQDDFAEEFNQYHLSCSQNCIVVYLENLSDENIALFKQKVSDSDAIHFEQSEGIGIDDANLNPGSGFGKIEGDANPIGSIGYRVKRNGQVGFITAGHVASSGLQITYENGLGSVIGTCESSVYSGSVDAAFIRITNSGYTPTNTIAGTNNTLSTTISEPGEGTVINKRGVVTGATSGKIESIDATYTLNGVTFTNLVKATYSAEHGDSGGVVYSYVSSTGTRYTLGIHKGRMDGYSYYVKANSINAVLGTSRY